MDGEGAKERGKGGMDWRRERGGRRGRRKKEKEKKNEEGRGRRKKKEKKKGEGEEEKKEVKEKEKEKKKRKRMRGSNRQRELSRMEETVLPIEGTARILDWRVEGLDSLCSLGQNTETSLNVHTEVAFLSRGSTSIKESFVLDKRKTAQLKTCDCLKCQNAVPSLSHGCEYN